LKKTLIYIIRIVFGNVRIGILFVLSYFNNITV